MGVFPLPDDVLFLGDIYALFCTLHHVSFQDLVVGVKTELQKAYGHWILYEYPFFFLFDNSVYDFFSNLMVHILMRMGYGKERL